MNKHLAKAVLATFRSPFREEQGLRLAEFSTREWHKNLHWLDASGLALYLLRELESRRMYGAVPPHILTQLKQRQNDNAERTRHLFDEFARINTAFQAAGLRYANLKGFTLFPDFCPDMSLRYQTDCDFLIQRSDATKARDVLGEFGYKVVADTPHVLELKTDVGTTPSIRDLYKARPQRSVEIHLCDTERFDRHPALLERTRPLSLHGHTYPALAHDDMFVSQAHHLYRHLHSEWTRISWFLELRHFVTKHRENALLWRTIRHGLTRNVDQACAVGFVIRFAHALLGHFAPQELAPFSASTVSSESAAWIDRYAETIALTDFPGSKLYLLLDEQAPSGSTAAINRRKLFPTRLPAPVVSAPTQGAARRFRARAARAGYILFRLRFHIAATSQCLLESWRWQRRRRKSATGSTPHESNQRNSGTASTYTLEKIYERH